MSKLTRRWVLLVLVSGVAVPSLGLVGAAVVSSRTHKGFVRRATIGDLEVIHSRVLIGTVAQQGTTRLAAGDRIVTEAAGRAKLLLGDGVTALLDSNTELSLGAGRLELIRGRLFVDSPEGKKTVIVLGTLNAPLSASKVAFERTPDGNQTKLFCAQGEIMVSGAGAPTRVPSGETLTLAAGKSAVEPEKAFDDWTGGLAVPWAATSLTRSAIADAWVTDAQRSPSTPLSISTLAVEVKLEGEFALTRARTRFYNGNDQTVTPVVRLALPPRAILTKITHRLSTGKYDVEGHVALCMADLVDKVELARLEWAGNGWISGSLPMVPAGSSIDLELEYGEWQTTRAGSIAYRYPIGHRADPPLVGELTLHVNAEQSGATQIEANHGAVLDGQKLVWRASDAKPSDDWVVSYSPSVVRPSVARAYVESIDQQGDPYVLIRAETAPRATAGIELAIVVDSSRSVGLSGLELSRQLVDALLGNLSEKDRVIAFVADEEPRPVGPNALSPNTPALRSQIQAELSRIRPGGASHLGRALERAADALDGSESPSSNRLVVYLGDGRPSLGELTADRLRAQLQRRANGIPRVAGIAVGTTADRWLLARLVAGSGPVHSVIDRSEAAQVAAQVVAAAEMATDRDVKFDLGPNVDRIYPREGIAVPAGSTAMIVGRLRGTLPQTVQLSYRDDSGPKTEALRVERLGSPSPGEVARQWALARVHELVTTGEGIEPALLLAQQHQLLLPWSEWVLVPGDAGSRASCSKFSQRIIDLSTLNDTPYARRIEAPAPPGAGWLEPPLVYDPGQSLEQGAYTSAMARISAAKGPMVTCRDARLPIIPNLPRELSYRVELSFAGRVVKASVSPVGSGVPDAIFFTCIERVIRSLTFVGADQPITVSGSIKLPAPKDLKKTQCSVASRLPRALRRNAWSGHIGGEVDRYEQALRNCELTTWSDRRELLLLLLGESSTAQQLIGFAASLAERGHSDAASFVRNAALGRVRSLDELRQLKNDLLRDEPNLDADIAAKVKRAATDKERLAVVTRALAMAPHSPLGRRLQLLLLERLGDSGAILREVEAIRSDPFTDAGLLALAAATLRRQNQAAEAQRSFSELFERIPNDPWVLGFAGDQLRVEGFAEQAVAAYDALGRVVPNDPATLLRTGLAQSSVGRVDIATRMLERAAQVPGRSDDQRLNELASVVRAIVLGRAQGAATDPAEKRELARRLAQTALPDVQAIALVEAPASPEQGLAVKAYRGEAKTGQAPDLDAAPLGVSAIYVDRGAQTMKIEISRRTLAGLGRPLPVSISVLYLGEHPSERQLRTVASEIAADQERVTVTLNGELRP